MFKFNLGEFKTRFTFYYIFKSTAWITPIFFLFLQKQVQLNIADVLKISGALMVLPFILDIPLGALADRVGARKLLVAGTLMQFFSLVGFFILPGSIAYIAYLISIIIAENCYSGAEHSYLNQNLSSPQEVKDFLKQLNQYFYFITIPALCAGVLLFQLNPYFPLYAQLVSFAIAFLFVANLKGAKPQSGSAEIPTFSILDIKQDLSTIIRSNQIMGLILFSGVFAGVVQISGKTIQGQIDQIASGQTGLWLVVSYVSANLASGTSLMLWRRISILNKAHVSKQILICFLLFLVAQIFLLNRNIWFIFIGYALLSGAKSIYRPIVSGELVHLLRQQPRMATMLSVVSTGTTLLVAGFHIVSGFLLAQSDLGLIALVALMSLTFILGFYLFKKTKVFKSYSGKVNRIVEVSGLNTFQQTYPQQAEFPPYHLVVKVAESWKVQVPKLISTSAQTMVFENIEHIHVSEVAHALKLKSISSLLENQVSAATEPIDNQGFQNQLNGSQFIFYLQEREYSVQPLVHKNLIGYTHGDLNPNNVIFNQDQVYLVDWDLFDVGYFWFDGLSLVTHPDLKLSVEEQLEILAKTYGFANESWLKRIVIEFYRFKHEQLQQFPEKSMQILAAKYKMKFEKLELVL